MILSGSGEKLFLGGKELNDSWLASFELGLTKKKKRSKRMKRSELLEMIEDLKSAKSQMQSRIESENAKRREEDLTRLISDGFYPIHVDNPNLFSAVYYANRVVIYPDYVELHTCDGVVLIKQWESIKWDKFDGEIEYSD